MRVTILVPVYKVERYIAECAESLFTQTCPDIDYIFCDDGTPDSSINVLQSVVERHPERQGRVTIITNETNKGAGATRRRLIESVQTEAFTFVDADDCLPTTAIAALVKCMEQSGADIVDGAFANYAGGSAGTPQSPYHGSRQSYQRRLMCQNIIPNRLWGKLYHQRVIERVPYMFKEGIDYSEDFSASVRLAVVTERAWTDELVYLYRTDNMSSYTKNVSRKSVVSYLRASNEVLRFFHMRGHLPLSLEIGMLNVYRASRDAGISLAETDTLVPYIPEHFTAILLRILLRSRGIIYAFGDILYRAVRMLVAR